MLLLPPLAAWIAVTQPIPPIGTSVPIASVPARELEAHVRTLSQTIGARDWRNVDNLDRAAEYIRAQLERAGASVTEQRYEVQGRTYRNVIGSIGPKTRERIVIGAHYDTHGPLPGADDNASGVAGLLALAPLLMAAEPAIGIDLVAFTLEEMPFFGTPYMGSAVHAAQLRRQQVPLRAMLALEMIGCFDDTPNSQRYPLRLLHALYPSAGNFIAIVGKLGQGGLVRRVKSAMRNAIDLPVRSINAPRALQGVDFSDHASYWDQGYPAVMITDTAFYRNPNYHTAGDTADTLDYRRMSMVVSGVFAAVMALAR
ncbi:MAG TPA: M28 family peptidase [Burkholderiaceae bacterium]|nr:M28 family peptidase [Burkholderiaceae bacterium]